MNQKLKKFFVVFFCLIYIYCGSGRRVFSIINKIIVILKLFD